MDICSYIKSIGKEFSPLLELPKNVTLCSVYLARCITTDEQNEFCELFEGDHEKIKIVGTKLFDEDSVTAANCSYIILSFSVDFDIHNFVCNDRAFETSSCTLCDFECTDEEYFWDFQLLKTQDLYFDENVANFSETDQYRNILAAINKAMIDYPNIPVYVLNNE